SRVLFRSLNSLSRSHQREARASNLAISRLSILAGGGVSALIGVSHQHLKMALAPGSADDAVAPLAGLGLQLLLAEGLQLAMAHLGGAVDPDIADPVPRRGVHQLGDRKSTRLNASHV